MVFDCSASDAGTVAWQKECPNACENELERRHGEALYHKFLFGVVVSVDTIDTHPTDLCDAICWCCCWMFAKWNATSDSIQFSMRTKTIFVGQQFFAIQPSQPACTASHTHTHTHTARNNCSIVLFSYICL